MKKITFGNPPTVSRTMRESLRTIRTNIEFLGDDINSIVMTSTIQNEGKTTTSFNLAVSLAENGKKVLFVDADLRKSVIIGRYHVKPEENEEICGLSHYLSGQQPIQNVVYSTDIRGLFTIFSGPAVSNATELLEKQYLKDLLEFGKEHFDYLILDTPPLSAAIDASLLANKCDGVVLVVDQGKAKTRDILQSKKQLEQANATILGVVLNFVELRFNYYSKYYGKYYGRYYGQQYGTKPNVGKNK